MKKGILTLLAAMLVICAMIGFIPQTAEPAFAEDEYPRAITMDTDVLGKDANKEGMQIVDFGGRKWYVIGYNGAGNSVASRGGAVTLLHQGLGEKTSFIKHVSDKDKNTYGGSGLETYVEGIFNNSFSAKERAAVSQRTLPGGSGNFDSDNYDPNKIKGDDVKAHLWPLSAAEAEQLPYFKGFNTVKWWLRSPGSDNESVGVVYDTGEVYKQGLPVYSSYAVRPAFDVEPKFILFASAAENGKVSGELGPDALTAVDPYSGNEWKLTIRDDGTYVGLDGHKGFNVTSAEPGDNGAVVVNYTGAVTGDNEYISAIATDSSDRVTWYGRIGKAAAEGSGSVTINTGGKLKTNETLYVYNEQYNGDSNTDCASDLKMVLHVTEEKLVPVIGKITSSKKTIKAGKSFKLKAEIIEGDGTVTFSKVSGNAKITVSKSGKVKVKKGLKKGKTYKIKVKAKVGATSLYKKGTRTDTISIKVVK